MFAIEFRLNAHSSACVRSECVGEQTYGEPVRLS